MGKKCKKSKKISNFFLFSSLIIIIVISGVCIIKYNFFKTEKTRNINISYLSDEFVNKYFKEISENNSNEDKDNMLIVISKSKIKNSYGAKNIIEAPNNQYILQYDSDEEKKSALEQLKKDKKIESVEENGVYTTQSTNYNSWGIEKMALDSASASSNSYSENLKPVTVAIIDTGCDMSLFNKYYNGKISETYNVLENSKTLMSDENGHGTHVSGTIAEGTPDNVKILPIKVSRDGDMYYTDVIAGINYIVRNKKADVINMSFGGYGYNGALKQAIESAKEQNIISVAAAGNENTSEKLYPAALDNTIAIASVDSNLKKSSFSNYGSYITFTAPGTKIKSIMGKDAAISKENGNNDDDDHETISGTSMATPHAVSSVAILKGYNKDLTLDNIIDILKESSIDLGEPGWDQYYGNGLISFQNVEFCNGKYCDKYGIYKNKSKEIINVEIKEIKFTKYNYYSITNLMGTKTDVLYADGTEKTLSLGDITDLEVLNYSPTISDTQKVTIKVGDISKEIEIKNPTNLESGWEYNALDNEKVEIIGYKNHNLEISKLYVPETIDSKQVTAFADDFKFSESGADFKNYVHLYLPSYFKRIGNYALSNTNIKYIHGTNDGIEIGNHAFESSQIETIDIPIAEIGEYAFKDCYELLSLDIIGKNDNSGTRQMSIGKYAFYNCKKLTKLYHSKYDQIVLDEIKEYTFYNCVSLSSIELYISSDIKGYAFYNTFMLSKFDFGTVNSIGEYAFSESGIERINIGAPFDTIYSFAFKNCKKLKEVTFDGSRIESKAFLNSGVEELYLYGADYIAEDAFAYSPIKKVYGRSELNGPYKVIDRVGIVENNNKLLIGVSNSGSVSDIELPDYITEIGNYAYTGNTYLRNVTIPETVKRLGENSFKDCNWLKNVYFLGYNLYINENTFKRTNEGEIKNEDLIFYTHKDSSIKDWLDSNNYNYRHFEPDKYEIMNLKDKYTAAQYLVNDDVPYAKLTYYEKETREEYLYEGDYSVKGPLSEGRTFSKEYQDPSKGIQFGDTYLIISIKTKQGYDVLVNEKVPIVVVKAIPTYTIPTDLTAEFGQKLSEIQLPDGFEWMDDSQIINKGGKVKYKAKYIPSDTKNYETIENIDIIINVNKEKKIINPEISIQNKVYDGKTNISLENINVSNLEKSEYSILSAISSDENVGKKKATIKLKLSDDKFIDYSFDNGKQEKDFIVDFTIEPLKISKPVSPTWNYVYNGKEITLDVPGYNEDTMIAKNNKGTNVGIYDVIISLKNTNYIWEDGTTKDVIVKVEISKADISVQDNSKDVTVKYDGKEHTIDVDLIYSSDYTLRYMDSNGEYTLNELPKYKEVGIYEIKYKVFYDNNHKEYFGKRTLTIEDDISYIINNYEVDKINNYISKIMVNTEYDTFKSNITLGSGYTVNIDYKEIDNKKILYTGGKTRIMHNTDLYKEFTNVVIGDINGDGKINSADLLKIRQHLLGTNVLNGAYFLSSDINYDNTINSADLLRVRQHLLGLKLIK